jgi:hypothetical protein
MKKTLLNFIFVLTTVFAANAQSFTIGTTMAMPHTMHITTDTTFDNSTHPNISHYLICSGVTVNYRDNSSMKYFYLEPYATLILDSMFSYGYSTVIMKPNAIFDANLTQIQKLVKSSSSVVLDLMPFPVWTSGDSTYPSVSFNYSLMPTVPTSCFTTGLFEQASVELLAYCYRSNLYVNNAEQLSSIEITNAIGKTVLISNNPTQIIEMDKLPIGIYFARFYYKNNAITYKKIAIN